MYNADERIEIIINTFINAVYLYDDKMIITFNIQDGNKLKKLELTELEEFGFNSERFTIAILNKIPEFIIFSGVLLFQKY